MKREYASKNFSLEYLRDVNLQEVGGYVTVCSKYLKPEVKIDYGFEEEDEEYLMLNVADVYDSVTDISKVDYNDYEFMQDEWEEFVGELMNSKKYNHYLVVAYNSRWNGASGYAIKNDYRDCFIRDYEVSQYYVKSSTQGKVLELKESHHDVPMGHKLLIIGLTETEYEILENKDIDEVFKYAEKYN